MRFEYFVKKRGICINENEPAALKGESIYAGAGESLSHLCNRTEPIENTEKYRKDWETYVAHSGYAVKRLEEEAGDGWHFELYYLQKVKSFRPEHMYSHFSMYAEIFRGKQPVDLFLVESQDKLDKKIIEIKKRYAEVGEMPHSKELSLEMPVLFTGQAAGILSHELLGHIFEIDNFFAYQYEKVLPLVENLKVDIMDQPSMTNGLGFYLYDDMGMEYKDITICSGGGMTGSLIGGSCGKKEVVHALRRDDYSKPCIPRMSNLIVGSKKKGFVRPNSYIEITKLGKCYINHKKRGLEICVEQGFICRGGEYTACLKSDFFHLSILALLGKMSAAGGQNDLCPLQCQKHGQVIDCTVQTMDWFLAEGLKNVLLF